MFYVIDYYTKETIGIFPTVDEAIQLSKDTLDSIVTNENRDEYFYINVDLPF